MSGGRAMAGTAAAPPPGGGIGGAAWAAAYAGAATLAAPLLWLLLRRRVRRGKEIGARLGERRGVAAIARPPGRVLWLHAASVGETLSALPLLGALPAGITVLFTTGTATAAVLLARRLAEAPPPPAVLHRFVPWDVPRWVSRFLDHWRPDAAAFVESEIWPNLVLAAARRGIPLALVNARLSARSARGWGWAPGFARRVLGRFAWVAAQSEGDAARWRALGAPRVDAPGHLKFAAPPLPCDAAALAALRARLGARPVWLAASTHEGEEAVVAAAHRALEGAYPGLLTIVAPRHPERGAAVASFLGGAPRRGLGEGPAAAGGFWVADTLGELGLLYRLAPVVFVGGSLVPRGGQNPLEPARLGCAVAAGPWMQNQAAAVAALRAAGAYAEVADAAALAGFVGGMLADPARRAAGGAAGAAAVLRDAGLPAVLAARLLALLG